jgi:predicted ATP-grasp superfamily ATP-dependent carboligase
MAPKLLIVAISGRALARSATKSGGRRVVVFDAFGDCDTRAMAEVVCVGAGDGVAIDAGRLMTALAAEPLGPDVSIVLGSGFDAAPQLASRLARYGRLYANDPAVVGALKDPELGIALLRACGWRVPATQREPPAEPDGWLEKKAGAAGGAHVRRAGRVRDDGASYFQREVRGQPLSVTFLGDGDRAYCLGFNRLRVEGIGSANYCYAGAIAGIDLPPGLRAQTQSCLDRLVRVTGLRGLAGVDFVLAGDKLTALEVNPRPTATFELYDDDFRDGLVHWHLASFERSVPELAALAGRGARAQRAIGVVYARDRVTVPRGVSFPGWCRDLPCAGSVIAAGAPIVSVFAEAASASAAEREIEARSRAAHELVARWNAPERRAVA